MKRTRPFLIAAAAWALVAAPGLASEEVALEADRLAVTVEIPRLNVSEYHRPYVAVWVQTPDAKTIVDLAIWYQVKGPDEDFGTKWLPDLRQWWRRSGRNQEFPIDAITGPTPPTGEQALKIDPERLAKLPDGKLTLVVEAVREVGDRELLEVPFTWPASEARTYEVRGKKELGKIKLTVAP